MSRPKARRILSWKITLHSSPYLKKYLHVLQRRKNRIRVYRGFRRPLGPFYPGILSIDQYQGRRKRKYRHLFNPEPQSPGIWTIAPHLRLLESKSPASATKVLKYWSESSIWTAHLSESYRPCCALVFSIFAVFPYQLDPWASVECSTL